MLDGQNPFEMRDGSGSELVWGIYMLDDRIDIVGVVTDAYCA